MHRPPRQPDAVSSGGAGIICHQTLSYGDYPGFGGAACRWFYDHYGYLCNLFRIYERLGGFTEVGLPQGESEEITDATT